MKFLCIVGLVLAGIVGWVLNIIQLCHATAFSGMLVAKVIGVFIPIIGAVLGFVG